MAMKKMRKNGNKGKVQKKNVLGSKRKKAGGEETEGKKRRERERER